MQFPLVPVPFGPNASVEMPILPIRLASHKSTVQSDALVDSGAMISVLPYDLGLQLGLDWNQIPHAISLSGALGGTAKAVVLSTAVGSFPPVNVVFAWSSNSKVRLILGQQNFFKEFDVSFFGSRGYFTLDPRP